MGGCAFRFRDIAILVADAEHRIGDSAFVQALPAIRFRGSIGRIRRSQ